MGAEIWRTGKESFPGEGRDFADLLCASIDFSGEDASGCCGIGFDEGCSSPEHLLTGEEGNEVLNELKKLTASAGFSRIINRNRKSSFRRRGRPGRRNKTSLVLIKERNKVEAQGKSFNR
jgi:hypothetical protein